MCEHSVPVIEVFRDYEPEYGSKQFHKNDDRPMCKVTKGEEEKIPHTVFQVICLKVPLFHCFSWWSFISEPNLLCYTTLHLQSRGHHSPKPASSSWVQRGFVRADLQPPNSNFLILFCHALKPNFLTSEMSCPDGFRSSLMYASVCLTSTHIKICFAHFTRRRRER